MESRKTVQPLIRCSQVDLVFVRGDLIPQDTPTETDFPDYVQERKSGSQATVIFTLMAASTSELSGANVLSAG